MALLETLGSAPTLSNETAETRAAKAMEAMVVKQLLAASGVFKGNDTPGSSIRSDLFADALADAVAQAGGVGLSQSLVTSPATPQAGAIPAADPRLLVDGGGRVTSGFGSRIDPIDSHQSQHPGVDVSASEGTPIRAAADGVVRVARARGGYGLSVEIDHGGGVSTLYGHASELLVEEGQPIHQGAPVARVGSTGRSTGPHLHFEVRVKGVPVDPARALKSYRGRDE
ncbi:MAG: M23 family metallopeptidase [Myxococcales bacterium]